MTTPDFPAIHRAETPVELGRRQKPLHAAHASRKTTRQPRRVPRAAWTLVSACTSFTLESP